MRSTSIWLLFLFVVQVNVAKATIQNVVVDVMGTLVQGIPVKNQDEVSNPKNLVTAGSKLYAVYPGAREVLELLAKQRGIKVYFYVDDEQQKTAAEILKKAGLPTSNLLTALTDPNWTSLTTVRFTHRQSEQSDGRMTVFNPIGDRFYYESFERSEAAKAKADPKKPASFATSRNDWSLSFFRFPYFYLALNSVFNGKTTLEQLGKYALSDDGSLDPALLKFVEKWRTASFAIDSVGIQSEEGAIKSCLMTKFDTDQQIWTEKAIAVDRDSACFKNPAEWRFAWMDKSKEQCGSFYAGYYYRPAAVADCSSSKGFAKLKGTRYTFSIGYKAFTLASLNKEKDVIKGISFPRVNAPLFRGTNACHFHYHPDQILKAFFGLTGYTMDSKLMSDWLKDLKTVDDVIDAHGDFYSKQKKSALENRFIKFDSGLWENFPADGVFASVYFETARFYSSQRKGCRTPNGMVISMHDYFERGIDLNYATGTRGEGNRDIDAGEYLMPIFIDQEEIDGMLFPEAKQAYFRVKEGAKDYVLVYEGVECAFKAPDGLIYECSGIQRSFDELGKNFPVYGSPVLAGKHLTASAVLIACPANQTCSLDSKSLVRHNVELSKRFSLVVKTDSIVENGTTVQAIFQE